jgi:hypothetical protein
VSSGGSLTRLKAASDRTKDTTGASNIVASADTGGVGWSVSEAGLRSERWWLAAATQVRESVRGALARQEGLSMTGLVSTGDVTVRRDSSPPVPGTDTRVEAA